MLLDKSYERKKFLARISYGITIAARGKKRHGRERQKSIGSLQKFQSKIKHALAHQFHCHCEHSTYLFCVSALLPVTELRRIKTNYHLLFIQFHFYSVFKPMQLHLKKIVLYVFMQQFGLLVLLTETRLSQILKVCRLKNNHLSKSIYPTGVIPEINQTLIYNDLPQCIHTGVAPESHPWHPQ